MTIDYILAYITLKLNISNFAILVIALKIIAITKIQILVLIIIFGHFVFIIIVFKDY